MEMVAQACWRLTLSLGWSVRAEGGLFARGTGDRGLCGKHCACSRQLRCPIQVQSFSARNIGSQLALRRVEYATSGPGRHSPAAEDVAAVADAVTGISRCCCQRQRPDFWSRPSVASAFLISDCEIPNCRAIALGLTPALKAARTAFSLPVVKPVPSLATAWRGRGFASAVGFSFAVDGSRPRRSASAVTAARRESISASSNRFSAPARSLGRKWRDCEAASSGSLLLCGMAECSGSGAFAVGGAENRSGVASTGRCDVILTMASATRSFASKMHLLHRQRYVLFGGVRTGF
jgi:hypothetical protein